MEDNLILVDPLDRPVGTATKTQAHRDGLLHRAFSVFIVHDGKMLLQRRNPAKYHSGGLWANACCSHPRSGERLADAVQRRMAEEIGFACPVEEIGHFVYRSRYAEHLYEYEYDHVFLGDYQGEVAFNPDEISEIRWIALDELAADLIANPQRYSSWFFPAASLVLEHLM